MFVLNIPYLFISGLAKNTDKILELPLNKVEEVNCEEHFLDFFSASFNLE